MINLGSVMEYCGMATAIPLDSRLQSEAIGFSKDVDFMKWLSPDNWSGVSL